MPRATYAARERDAALTEQMGEGGLKRLRLQLVWLEPELIPASAGKRAFPMNVKAHPR